MLKFILKDGGQLPAYGQEGDAGLDIKTIEEGTILPGARKLVHTGVYLAECPKYNYLRVAPRSKLANKHGINVLAGVIDQTYRGEICVILHNTDQFVPFQYKSGHAIAQLIPTDITPMRVVEVDTAEATLRGASGTLSTEERR